MAKTINFDREIYEGWTVRHFIEELEWQVDDIINGRTCFRIPTNRKELINMIVDIQPYYKKEIKEVTEYFCNKYNIK